MVETISPVVHGGRGRWLGTLALHTLSATGTAALFGAALGMIGGALGAPWGRAGLLALGAVAAVYALGALTRLHVPVLQLRRQVPDWWRTYFGRPFAALLYGAGLGIGFLTYLSTGTLVVVAFAAIASGSPAVGALIMAPFGLVRGLSAIVAWRSLTQEQSRALVDRLVSMSDVARRMANGVVLIVIAGIAAAASIRAGAGSWRAFAAAVLAAVFAWASASKIASPRRWRRWRRRLAELELPPSLERVAVWAVPSGEAIVPVLVVAGLPRVAALWSGALLVAFSVALVASVGRMSGRIACGCFGGRGSVALRSVVARNTLLLAIAASVASLGADAPAVWLPGAPAVGDALPLALTLGALAASVLVAWRASVWLDRGGVHDGRDARRSDRPPAATVRARVPDRGGCDGGSARGRRKHTGTGPGSERHEGHAGRPSRVVRAGGGSATLEGRHVLPVDRGADARPGVRVRVPRHDGR